MAFKKTEVVLNVQTWKDCQDRLGGKASSEERDNVGPLMRNKKQSVCAGAVIDKETCVSPEPATRQVTFLTFYRRSSIQSSKTPKP